MAIIFQPKGAGTVRKEGTILVSAPKAAGTGWYNDPNYRIDTYHQNYAEGIPTTGEVNDSYSGRFDDTNYYTT